MLKPLPRIPLSESAYQEIRESILSGRFAPGAPLGEHLLAGQLQTSRGPIREALSRLEAEGLLVNRAHRGMSVREFSPEDIVNLYSTRIAIESAAARLSIRRESTSVRLRRTVEEMRLAAARGDLDALTEQEFAFHRVLCVESRNQYLVRIFDSLTAQVRMVLAFDNRLHSSRRPLLDFASEHEALVVALEGSDEDNAIRLLENHIISGVGELVMSHLPAEEAGRIEQLATLLLGPRDLFLLEARQAHAATGDARSERQR